MVVMRRQVPDPSSPNDASNLPTAPLLLILYELIVMQFSEKCPTCCYERSSNHLVLLHVVCSYASCS